MQVVEGRERGFNMNDVDRRGVDKGVKDGLCIVGGD